MSGTQNCLVEIPFESFPSLRDKFKVDWPRHILAFHILDDYVRQDQKCRDKKKFYSLNGEWEQDGTFVAFMVREIVVHKSLHLFDYARYSMEEKRFSLLSIPLSNALRPLWNFSSMIRQCFTCAPERLTTQRFTKLSKSSTWKFCSTTERCRNICARKTRRNLLLSQWRKVRFK